MGVKYVDNNYWGYASKGHKETPRHPWADEPGSPWQTGTHQPRDVDSPANRIDPSFIISRRRSNANQPVWQPPGGISAYGKPTLIGNIDYQVDLPQESAPIIDQIMNVLGFGASQEKKDTQEELLKLPSLQYVLPPTQKEIQKTVSHEKKKSDTKDVLKKQIPPSLVKDVLPPSQKEISAQQKRLDKKKHHRKTTTTTTTDNSGRTITTTTQDLEPYPEEDIGTPPSLTSPDWQDTTSPDDTTTIAPPATPPPSVGGRSDLFHPQTGTSSRGRYDSNGCAPLHYHSGPDGVTCRWVANTDDLQKMVGEGGYKIEAWLHLGDPANKNNKELSITSGGPGSTKGNCCGFTTRINIDTGELQFEAEGPAQTQEHYCKGSSCVDSGPISIGKNLYNQDVYLAWICTKSGNTATYQAIASGPAGTVRSKQFTGLTAKGQPLIPFHYIDKGGGIKTDGNRVRVDSCKTVTFKKILVSTLSSNSYYGELGYID